MIICIYHRLSINCGISSVMLQFHTEPSFLHAACFTESEKKNREFCKFLGRAGIEALIISAHTLWFVIKLSPSGGSYGVPCRFLEILLCKDSIALYYQFILHILLEISRSMASCKTVVTPVLTHWSYHSCCTKPSWYECCYRITSVTFTAALNLR